MHRACKNFGVLSMMLATALSGCNRSPSVDQSTQQAAQANGQIPSAPANDPDAQASALMAAAEPFENLTEGSFAPDTGMLDNLIAKAKASANGASKLLAPAEAQALSSHVAAIDAARAANNRADLAIAAVEGYRTLVSNSGDGQKVPKEVSLLDYSGFRYQADLKAAPVRWSDAVLAIDFADAQWKLISARVSDLSLRAKMSAGLTEMRTATRSNNAKAAMTASTRELDLVDKLEKYFGHCPSKCTAR